MAEFDPVSRTDSLPSVGRISNPSRMDDSRELSTSRRRLDIDGKVKIDGVVVSKSVIGKGSFAAVHEGKTAEKSVIVKRVHDALLTSPSDRVDDFVKSLERHWPALGLLEHPQILPYLGVCVLDDFTPGLVREKCDVSLRQRVGLEPRLDLRQRVEVASDVAEALHYLHEKGIVHGRLTTSHVLLGEGSGAKVCDAGLVNVYAEVFGSTVRTHFVTPYTSPERQRSPETISESDDCFAYGLVLLSDEVCREPPSLVTNPRLPSGADSTSCSPELQRHVSDLAQVEDTNPLREIIVACLQDDPLARPTASKLVEKVNKLKESDEYRDGKGDDDEDGGGKKVPGSNDDTRSFWSLPGEVSAHTDRGEASGERRSVGGDVKSRTAYKSWSSLKPVDPSRRGAKPSSTAGTLAEEDGESSQNAATVLVEVTKHLDSIRGSLLFIARDMGNVLFEAQGAHNEARSAREMAAAAREEASKSHREADAARQAASSANMEAKGSRQEACAAKVASQRLSAVLLQKADISIQGDEFEALSFVAEHPPSLPSTMADEPAPGEMVQGPLPPIPEDRSSPLSSLSSLTRPHQKMSPVQWDNDFRRRMHNISKISTFLSHVRRFDFAVRCLLSLDLREEDASRVDVVDIGQLRRAISSVLAQAEREPWLAFPFGQWTANKQLPHAAGGAAYACVHNDVVYVASRQMTAHGRQATLCCSRNLEDWEDVALPPSTAACHALFSYGDNLFIVTRPEDGEETSQRDIVWRKNTGHWLEFAKLRNVQWHFGLAVYEHTAIFAGGWNGHTELDVVEVLDLKTAEWLDPLTPMPKKAFAMQALVHNEQLVLVGATTREADFSMIHSIALNPNAAHYNMWQVQESPMIACGACAVQKHIVLVGGWDKSAGHASPLMKCLDPEHSQWLHLPLLQIARVRPALVFFRQKLLCVGGSATPSRDAERINILEVMRLEVSA